MFPQSLRTYSDPVVCDIMQQTEEYVAGRRDNRHPTARKKRAPI